MQHTLLAAPRSTCAYADPDRMCVCTRGRRCAVWLQAKPGNTSDFADQLAVITASVVALMQQQTKLERRPGNTVYNDAVDDLY